MKTSLTRSQWVLIFALLLAATPYFVRLGASSLWDSNEAFYAETPREMMESHDYLNPAFNYHTRLNKPPLSYWVVIPFYKLLGVTEASERLPIALAAMIMIATAFGLGRACFSAEAGLLAAIGLAAAPRFMMFSRRILIDVYVAMFMALALFLFVLAEKFPSRRRLYLILTYGCIGLGVITKGPVAAAVPAAVLVAYLAAYGQLGRLREMMLPTGLIVVALIVLPWYLSIYSQHGWNHIETFILKDNFSRYTQPVWGPQRGVLFYVPVVFGDFFPWSLFLLPLACFAAASWLHKRRNGRAAAGEKVESATRASALLAIWIAVILLFFSISRSKEDLYILPIYPAAAALVGGWLAGPIWNGRSGRVSAIRWTTLALAAVIAAAGAAILYLFGSGAEAYDLAGAKLIGYAAIVGGLGAACRVLLNKMRSAIVVAGLSVVACNWIFVLRTLPDFERYKPVRSLCEVIASQAGSDAQVGYYRSAYPSMVFYIRRPIFEYYQQREIEDALMSSREVFCLMSAGEYESLRLQLPVQTRVLASHPIFQVKLKGVLDRVELPQVVLISNKGGANVER